MTALCGSEIPEDSWTVIVTFVLVLDFLFTRVLMTIRRQQETTS